MKRKNLEELGLEKEQIDKVMALYGEAIGDAKSEVETLKEKVATYETEINELKDSSKDNADWKAKFEELDNKIKQQDAEREAKKQEEILNNNIAEVFGDKKFTSEYARKGLMADIKAELSKAENQGKGIKEIFDSLTKDTTDIFATENQVEDMAGMGDSEDATPKTEMPMIF